MDVLVFVVIRQALPDGYDWFVSTLSQSVGVSSDVAQAVLVISGFLVVLICILVILYLFYNILKQPSGGTT